MDTLDLDQVMNEIIPRGDSKTQAPTAVNFPARQFSTNRDDATAALDLVSEAAAAIRALEVQSAEAVARAQDVANAVIKKLDHAEARVERTEMALRQAEAKVAELTAADLEARNEIEMLQSRLAAKEAELAAAEQRANDAEQRADDANASIQRIVNAIRSQLPLRPGVAAEQADADA